MELKTVIDQNHQKALSTAQEHAVKVKEIVDKMQEENAKTMETIRGQQEAIATEWGQNVLTIAKECAKVIESYKSDNQNRAD